MGQIKIVQVGKIPDIKQLKKSLEDILYQEARNIKQDFGRTIATWKRKPQFKITRKTAYDYLIATNNEIYGYIDEGTRPHVIKPRKAKALRFNSSGFRPKTSPRTLVTTQGKPASPPTVFSQGVNHPGMEARNYTTRIQDKSQKRLTKEIRKAMKNRG